VDGEVLVGFQAGVAWAEQRGNPNGVPNVAYIIVEFNDTATDAAAQPLIDSIDGLRVSAPVVTSGFATVAARCGVVRDRWVVSLTPASSMSTLCSMYASSPEYFYSCLTGRSP
jgi:hypothetical protein